MEENNYDAIPYPPFRFSEFINRKAKSFCDSYLFEVNQFESKEDIPKIINELNNLQKGTDCIQFIFYLINHITELTFKHTTQCDKPGCRIENESQEYLYFLYRKLEEYDITTDIESFTEEEIHSNNHIFNQINQKLDELKAGDEIIFDEVESGRIDNVKYHLETAKQLQALGKPNLRLFVAGIIAEYFIVGALNKYLPQLVPFFTQLTFLSNHTLLN